MQGDTGQRPGLAAFGGNWTLERRIEDALSGQILRFSGTARFTPGAPGLVCDEAGEMRLPGQPPMPAGRRYLWRVQGGDIAVLFADGRPFHLIGPGARPEAVHDCPPDLYRVRYDFRRWPDWEAEWRVQGPRKSYVSVTAYRPAE